MKMKLKKGDRVRGNSENSWLGEGTFQKFLFTGDPICSIVLFDNPLPVEYNMGARKACVLTECLERIEDERS